MPMKIKEIKDDFFDLLDDRSVEMISRKVARMNGDVRVAFDLVKTCFNKLFYQVKHIQKDNEISAKLSTDLVFQVFEEKYGSKLKETLQTLPR
jgi:Cdc6-like AAA superfamily ATPase